MKHFRNDDFVYYALKAKPIAKRTKPLKKILPQVQIVATTFAKPTLKCLQQANLNNISVHNSAKTNLATTSQPSNHFQATLIEMQKAVREQQAMYHKYCSGERLNNDDTYSFSQEASPLLCPVASFKNENPIFYFSQLLEDPKDKENMLFLEHATEPNLQKEAEKSQQVADYDVSAYFTV